MQHLLRISIVTLLVLMLVPAFALAGDYDWKLDQEEDTDPDDDYKWKTWKTHRSHGGFSGFGGFFFEGQSFDSDGLDGLASSMGLDEFDGFVYGWGGWGMGHVGDGWRIGGGGSGGHLVTDGVYVAPDGDRYNRTLEMEIGMGGFMVEYSPWMFGPVNFGIGATLGGGGVSVVMSQDTGTYTWEELYGQYVGDPSDSDGDNIRTEIQQGFLMAEPYLTVRVHVLDWMAISGSAGYKFTSLNTENWIFNENELTGDGPELDLNKPFYRVGLVFGG